MVYKIDPSKIRFRILTEVMACFIFEKNPRSKDELAIKYNLS